MLTLRMMGSIALLALPPLLLLPWVTLRQRSLTRSVGLRVVAIFVAVVVGVWTLSLVFKDFAAQKRNHKEIRYLLAPVNVVYAFTGALARDASIANRPRQPVGTDARLGASWGEHNKPLLFVGVVGETARAADWGLSGRSPHDTTPNLAQRAVINFAQVTSCGTNTEVSLPCMFSSRARTVLAWHALRDCSAGADRCTDGDVALSLIRPAHAARCLLPARACARIRHA